MADVGEIDGGTGGEIMDFEEWYHRKIFIQSMDATTIIYIFCLVMWILSIYSWGRHDVAMYWLYGGMITLGVWISNFIISKFLTWRKIKRWKEGTRNRR